MNSNTIVLFILTILFIIVICDIILNVKEGFKKHPELKKESIDTDLANMMLQDNFVAKVNLLIDSVIKEHADIYQVMVLSTNEDKAQYITSEQQDEMQKYVIHMTLKNLSPELKSIMKLVYNIDSAEDLRNVISIRVKLYLINFIVEYNKDVTE